MCKIKEIFLHIGVQKTGTSSIQDTLLLNHKILHKNDYLYPESWPQNHSFTICSVFVDNPEKFHVNVIKGYDSQQVKEVNQKYLNDLEAEINQKQCSKLIISGEAIADMSINNLCKLKEYLQSMTNGDIKVIMYVRNHMSWAISAYQQRIKGFGDSHDKAFEMIKRIMKNPFKNRIQKFIKVFGDESINVYSFENAINHKYGIVGHFLSVIGLNENEIGGFNFIKSNDSISIIAADILAYINDRLPMFKNDKINEGRFFGDINPILSIGGPKFDLPFIDKKTLLDICLEDINWLKDNYQIDYSGSKDLASSNIECYFTDETINDIKLAYIQLCAPLKMILLEYLQKRMVFSSNHDRAMLNSLFNELKV